MRTNSRNGMLRATVYTIWVLLQNSNTSDSADRLDFLSF
jgi:hypothetical protein